MTFDNLFALYFKYLLYKNTDDFKEKEERWRVDWGRDFYLTNKENMIKAMLSECQSF